MPCDSITELLDYESGRVGPEIYNRLFNRSPWVTLVRRGEFPQGMGTQIGVLTYERSAPTQAEPAWTAILPTEGGVAEGGSCLPPASKVGVGWTLRNYNLARRALEGPDFCAEDIRFAYQLRDQLNAIITILTEYTLIEWEIRDRHEYLRLAKWKVTMDGGLTTTQNTSAPFFSGCPTSILTQGALNRWRVRLLRDGAAGSALGRENNSPVLTLITSAETSEDLIFRNADIRQDLRWGKPNELLAPFGVTRSYRGFYHLIDMYPMRGSCSAGTFTEIPVFANEPATGAGAGALKQEVNAGWQGAGNEISFIFDPMVFEQLIPAPISNPANNFKFDPVNYMGNWKLRNILDRACNPDGTIVYHRGILAAGSKPVHPERGVAFLHKVCDPALNLVTSCS